MATVDTIKKNIVPLEDIPQSIRDWLGSDVLKFSIINLNNRLNLKNWKITIIPELLLEITIREIAPEELIPELAKRLDLSHSTASLIAKTIDEQLLRPIQRQLKNELGVDLDLIFKEQEIPPSYGVLPLEKGERVPPSSGIPPSPFLKEAPEGQRISEKGEKSLTASGPLPLEKGEQIPSSKPEIAETTKIDIAKVEAPPRGPEPHIIYKEIKTFKVPITISEQKSAAINNAPKIAKENLPSAPPTPPVRRPLSSGVPPKAVTSSPQVVQQSSPQIIPPQQTERMSFQQLLESKKNNAENIQAAPTGRQEQTIQPNIAKPPLPFGKQTMPAENRQTAPAIPPRPAQIPSGLYGVHPPKVTTTTEEGRRIPIRPEQKTATMLPKNFQQTQAAANAGQAKLTKTRIVHYSDLKTPLNLS